MVKRSLKYLPCAFLSLLVGLAAVQLAIVDVAESQPEPIAVAGPPSTPAEQTASTPFEVPPDNCGPWTDDVPLGPIISKWLRDEEIKNVPYCSDTAIQATSFNPSNVRPELIDLNEDGIDELAIRYLCSPTGNCSMKIYQRTGRSYRQIFAELQMVNSFDKQGGKHAGFCDLQTRAQGSCCDGDQVIYRFSGRSYKPVSCAEYSYWDHTNGLTVDENPVITPRPCSNALGPL